MRVHPCPQVGKWGPRGEEGGGEERGTQRQPEVRPQEHRVPVLNRTVSILVSHSSLSKYKRLIVSGFTAHRGLGQKVNLKCSVSVSVPLQLVEQLKFRFDVES